MSSNITIPATAAALYAQAGVDFSSLNWLEKQWAAWYMWIGNPTLATGILSFVIHETVYIGRSVLWIIVDQIQYFRKWKLQSTKMPSAKQQWECTKFVLLTHLTLEPIVIWSTSLFSEYVTMQTWQVPFPPITTIIPQVVLFFILQDAYQYYAHQLLHYGPFYRHIHKLHHKYSTPFGITAQYAHPGEVFIFGIGTIGAPLLYCYLTKNLHVIAVYCFTFLRVQQAIDSHSGYDFPWSLRKILPFWAGAEFHDFHHTCFTNNYATSFRYLDAIFGTDNHFRTYRRRLEQGTRAGEDKAALEKRLLEEVEREGLIAEHKVETGGKIKTS